MSSSLRPQFFCTRPNGTLTPLIAVDELPAHITIHGAPRVLSPNETQGMTSLGAVSTRGQFYSVEGAAPASGKNQPGSNDLQSHLLRLLNDENIPAAQRNALGALLQQSLPQNWQVTNPPTNGWLIPNNGSSTGAGNSQQPPSRNIKKEFCSYWIRHGECDYSQQGCLYKHEMPHDRAMLEKLGLRDIPRWYRDKYNIPSLLPNGHGHPRSHAANGNEMALRSIQYTPQMGANGAGEHSDINESVKQDAPAYTHQQHQHGVLLPGTPFSPLASPTGPFTPRQAPRSSSGHLNAGNRKFDPLPFDHAAFIPNNNPPYRPSNETSFEASGKYQHENVVQNFPSLTLNPITTNSDYLPATFDSPVSSGGFKHSFRSRRLYQGTHGVEPSSSQDLIEANTLHAYHNQATASSNGASPTSKTTGSVVASPVADVGRGSTNSNPPTRGPSPSAPSPGASPGVFRGRGRNNRGQAKAFGTIGTKKSNGKQSVESSEDDTYLRGKK
ncbi:uncharacterized protein BDW70DRAFT_157208 [Aspergillus foveolatus]|uniref:uncharacterized protein n=1 Tax=Aspergillus foveolatus TaxID=210207 RepID=UPI003CCE1751